MNINAKRGASYYVLAAFFTLFVIFLYGPITAVVVLSFQGPDGGLTFPMNGIGPRLFNLFEEQMVGDFKTAFVRSFSLALIVMVLTVVVSLAAGLAFRRPFRVQRLSSTSPSPA